MKMAVFITNGLAPGVTSKAVIVSMGGRRPRCLEPERRRQRGVLDDAEVSRFSPVERDCSGDLAPDCGFGHRLVCHGVSRSQWERPPDEVYRRRGCGAGERRAGAADSLPR